MITARQSESDFKLSRWSQVFILIAGLHTLAWGVAVLLSSADYFAFSGLNAELILLKDTTWGMFGILGGLLYIASVVVPQRMGLGALVFFLINLVGLALMVRWAVGGWTNPLASVVHISGDLAGVIGFGMAAWEQYRWKYGQQLEKQYFEGGEIGEALAEFKDQSGNTLKTLNQEAPVLLVFLRHFGCTFCREALLDLSRYRNEIERSGVRIVLVHMVDEHTAAHHIAKYEGMSAVSRISDPEKRLYEVFGLSRGSLGQLFGIKEWVEGFRAGILNGHLVGKQTGDGFQMPGVFLIRNGNILRGFRHKNAADRPDYCYTSDCHSEGDSMATSASAAIS